MDWYRVCSPGEFPVPVWLIVGMQDPEKLDVSHCSDPRFRYGLFADQCTRESHIHDLWSVLSSGALPLP
jgi:hypothetical protein